MTETQVKQESLPWGCLGVRGRACQAEGAASAEGAPKWEEHGQSKNSNIRSLGLEEGRGWRRVGGEVTELCREQIIEYLP
jgi:hypothetical protein